MQPVVFFKLDLTWILFQTTCTLIRMECTMPDSEQSCNTTVSLSEEVSPIPNQQTDNGIDPVTPAEVANVSRSKKELKRERKLQNRLKMKAEWKKQRKLKKLRSKERRKMEQQNTTSCSSERKPKRTERANTTSNFRVVLDFSYDELMTPKDLTKCANQVARCYSANRWSSNPLQLSFCSFSGKIKEEMSRCYEHGKWNINFHKDSYLDVFPKEQLVYLTSESRNVLETLDENKVYIIGGLVDHNAHKGVSYRKAVKEGISHAQLPIRKHIQMKTRSVLTINHVFEIVLKVSNGEPWTEALRNSIPPRFLEAINPIAKNEVVSESAVSSDEDEKSQSQNYVETITDIVDKSERECDISSCDADKT